MTVESDINRQFMNYRTGAESFTLPIGRVFEISHFDVDGVRHTSNWQIEGVRHAPYPSRELSKPADTEEVVVICRPIDDGSYVDALTMEAHPITREDVGEWFPEHVQSLLLEEERRAE